MAKIEQSDKDTIIILRKELAFQKKEKEELLSKLNALEKIDINKSIDTNLHNIFMQLPAAICILRGTQHIFYMANDRYMQLIGRRDFIGKPIKEAFPELEGQGFFELLDGVYETRKPFIGNEMTVKLDKGNGKFQESYFNFVYQPSYDINENIDGIIIHAVDVTEQVNARRKVDIQNQLFSDMLMTAPGFIATLGGTDHVYELVNEKYQSLFGKRKIQGKPIMVALPELEGQGFDTLLDNVYNTGEPYVGINIPITLARDEGLAPEERYFNFSYQPMYNENKKIFSILVFGYEVTEQVTAEQKALNSIEESNTRYLTMLMHSPFAFSIMKGRDMVITLANDLMKQFWGKGMDVEGKTLLQVLPELKHQPFPKLIDTVFTTHKPVYLNEILAQLQHKHKLENKYFNIIYQPYYEADDTVSGVTTIAYDVTEMVLARKKIEESEIRYKELIYSSTSLIAILKGEENIISIANDAIIKIWGKGKDVIGKPFLQALPELVEQNVAEELHKVYTTGIPSRAEDKPLYIVRHGKKELLYYSYVFQPQRNAEGIIEGIAIIGSEVTSQALLNLKIKASEEQFRLLVLQAPVAICVMRGKNYIIEIINKGMYEMWDRTLEEALNKPAFEVLPELMEQGFKELLDNVYNTGQRFVAAELPISLKRNGKIENAFVKFVYEPLREIDGTISGIMALAHEITEQVLSRKKIEESETKFRTLIEDAPVATCFFTGREMRIEVANDIMLDYWGKGKQIIGKNLADAVPELKNQPFLQILDDVFTTGKIYESKNEVAQLQVNNVLGTYYFNYTYKPIRNDAGEVYGIINMAINVTEQVLAMKKLEASEEQFSAMADNISQFAWMADETGWIYWYNKRWYDYTGTNHEERQGWEWQKALHPDMAQGVIKSFKKAIEAGKDWEDTFLLRGKDGVYLWFLSRAVPLKDNEGKVIKWFGTNTDITEQKENNKKAEAATLMAEDAMKAKQQFLSNMSHEIRTPMNAIIGFTNVVLKTKLDENQIKYINAIKASGDSLIMLIDDILDLAKVDAGKMIFQIIPFKLSESMNAIIHLFEIKIQEKNLELVNQYDATIPEILLGDPLRLHQIIINLLSNAIKFTAKGKIGLSVRLLEEDDEKATIEFSIKDTGIGIPENRLEYIFGAFQQATNETSQLFGGTGLGLAIVKQLVEYQSGTLAVTSKVDEGSNFSFVLSFKKTVEDTAEESDLEITPTIKNLKILVVEDVKLNQILMKIILEDFGIEVDLADNGKIAIEKLNANNYDIIFMDLQMPEMNGFEATQYIRNKMNSQIPIIALTADVTTMDVEKCKSIGMNDYISKPVDEKLLYKKIVKYLPNPNLKKNS